MDGARRPRAVHAHHGCEVQCARCLLEIIGRIRQAKAEDVARAAASRRYGLIQTVQRIKRVLLLEGLPNLQDLH